MCVYIIMRVCRDICVTLPTHTSGGRQEPTPVLVSCELSRLEMKTEPVCPEQPCTLVPGACEDVLGVPRLPPALRWRRLHPLCRLGAVPPVCPRLCVCLRAALRAGPEAPEKHLLKKWPWRLCGCSQELWDGRSHSHPFTSPGFSPGHNWWTLVMFPTEHLMYCVSPPGRQDAPRGSRGPGGRHLAGGRSR